MPDPTHEGQDLRPLEERTGTSASTSVPDPAEPPVEVGLRTGTSASTSVPVPGVEAPVTTGAAGVATVPVPVDDPVVLRPTAGDPPVVAWARWTRARRWSGIDDMIRQLAHVCIHTRDLDAMVDFYSGKLGLPVQFRLRNDDGETVGVYLGCGQTTFLELFDQDRVLAMFGGDKVDLTAAPTRLQHFCFEVTGLADMRARLDAEDIPYLDVGMGLDNALQMWVGDPDGNAVELMEYTSTSLQLVGEADHQMDARS